jgi:hypothetical protein
MTGARPKATKTDSQVLITPFLARRRWLLVPVSGALLLALGALVSPRRFLPLRWQYPSARRAIDEIERFKAGAHRLPSQEELWKALDPYDWPCSECYEVDGQSYTLIAAASFDWSIQYDSRTREWRRYP